jgi:hypothetical protein
MSDHFESNAVSDVISFEPPKTFGNIFLCPVVKRNDFVSSRRILNSKIPPSGRTIFDDILSRACLTGRLTEKPRAQKSDDQAD